MKSEEMRAAGQRPAKAVSDIRFVGGVNGRYTLESRRTAIGGRAQVFACRAKSISLREALLAAPVSGTVGEGLTVHFDQIGILKGQVSKVLADGFVMSIAASEARLAKLAATIGWLKRRTMHSVVDRREH